MALNHVKIANQTTKKKKKASGYAILDMCPDC